VQAFSKKSYFDGTKYRERYVINHSINYRMFYLVPLKSSNYKAILSLNVIVPQVLMVVLPEDIITRISPVVLES